MKQSFWILPVVVATAGAMSWVRYGSPIQWFHHSPRAAITRQGHVQALTADAEIKILIKKNLRDIMDCYNERLHHGLKGEGDLKISWEINGKGEASHFAEMGNDLEDSELYDCSAEAISQWDFPAGRPFFVHYTFHLKQKNQPNSGRDIASSDELNETMPIPHQLGQNPVVKDSQ